MQAGTASLVRHRTEDTMPAPDPSPAAAVPGRIEAAARLRAAVHAALLQGRELSGRRPQLSGAIRPLLQRLEEIRAEVDHLNGLRGAPLPPGTAPIWID